MYVAVEWYANRAKATRGRVRTPKAFAKLEEALLQISHAGLWECDASSHRFHPILEGTKIASLIPCRNFLSAGAIVASAPRNFTRPPSTK
jgi:hypothetical protein